MISDRVMSKWSDSEYFVELGGLKFTCLSDFFLSCFTMESCIFDMYFYKFIDGVGIKKISKEYLVSKKNIFYWGKFIKQ